MIFTFCFSGYLSVFFHFHKNIEDLNIKKITQKQTWIAEIKEPPLERKKSYKVIAKLYAVSDTTCWITNKVILYLQKDSAIKNYEIGDNLIIHTILSFIELPQNPYQFDYNKFVKMKGIYLTGYVEKQCWTNVKSKKTYSIKKYASYLQRFLSEKLIASGLSGAEYSIAAAILLGNDETLEPELKASYAAAGTSHILCVSGMHVGVIFMILNFLLLPLGASVKANYIRNAILLVAVWFYANITGLSPSVTRAALMFTFVIFGKFLRRQSNIFHSLFASLFILLCINPILLFNVGFQLSYLAVFGIVLFQKKIVQWVHPKTKAVNYIWNLATVSVAAQITTAPIAIYYFEQFPNYFLLANLFVIPVSFVMTITGVATLALSFNSFLSGFFGCLLRFEVKTMNETIACIEGLPGSLVTGVSLHFFQVILLYIIILSIIILSKKRKKQLLFVVLIMMNIFLFIHIIHIFQNKHHIEVVNYAIQKSAAFQFCYQGNAIIFSDSIQNEQDKRYQLSIQNHDTKMHLKNRFVKFDEDFENSFLCKQGNYICFQNKIYVLKKESVKTNKVKLVIIDNH
jgi:competence protein ComEC